MARFQEQQAFIPNNMNQGEPARLNDLSSKIGGFSSNITQLAAGIRQKEGELAGQQIDVKNYQPTNKATIYGQAYDSEAGKVYLAATRNDYTRRITELEAENLTDPAGFKRKADTYRAELLSSVPQELRNFTAIDFDASANKVYGGIFSAHAKTQLEADRLELNNASVGVRNDALESARSGDVQAFMARREAFVATVQGWDGMLPNEIAAMVSSFDQEADIAFHTGEIDKFLQRDDIDGAIEYTNHIKSGAIRALGGQEADYATVYKSLTTKVHAYMAQENAADAYELGIAQTGSLSNLSGWMRTYADNPALGEEDLKTMFKNGRLTSADYKAGMAALKTSKEKESPEFEWYFRNLVAGGATQEELQSEINSAVVRKEVSLKSANALMKEAEQASLSPIGTEDAKRQLQWLKGTIGADVDPLLSKLDDNQKRLNAEVLRLAEDSIMDGMNARDAVEKAYEYHMKMMPVSGDLYTQFGPMRTMQETQAVLEQLMQAKARNPAVPLDAEIEKVKAHYDRVKMTGR